MFDAMKKRASDAAAFASAKAAEGAAAAQARVDTAKEGKAMLDEGGKPVESKVAAKALGIKAVGVDARLVGEKLPIAVAEYKNAAEKAKEAITGENASALSSEEKQELEECAKAFELRAAMLEDMLKQLTQAGTPAAPTQSLAEKDAWRILSARGLYRDVSEKVTSDYEQGLAAARAKAAAATAASAPPEPGAPEAPAPPTVQPGGYPQ